MTFYNPVKIYFDEDIPKLLADNQAKAEANVLLIAFDEMAFDFESVSQLMAVFSEDKVETVIFKQSNPSVEDLYELYRETQDMAIDLMVAIGGGSVMDVAKGLKAIRNLDIQSVEDVRQAITQTLYLNQVADLDLLAIPTTSGTGSEVTSWATIWDNQLNLKYSVTSHDIYPSAALIDSSLTAKLPLESTVATALDAINHATEAYWSKQSNIISRLYALEAIPLLFKTLQELDVNHISHQDRYKLAKGSLLAGLAFSNTRTTACHALSYPLTHLFGIQHGIAVALTLAPMMEINEEALFDKEALLEAFGIENVAEIHTAYAELFHKFAIPNRLSQYNIQANDLDLLIDKSFTKGRIDNNPVDLSQDDVKAVLTQIL